MFLSRLVIQNFRQFGDGDTALDVAFNSGVTALVGQNDSGKSAIIDAIRYALLTRDQDFIRIQPEDFHLDQTGKQATDIFIRCTLSELDDDEKGAFAEYLSYEGDQVSLLVNWTAKRLSESPGVRRWVDVSVRSGMDSGLRGQFVGVGIFVGHNGEFPTVSEPMYNGPAFKAGLLSHDRIVAVDGKSTKGFDGRKLGSLVRGEKGTKVTLSVLRAGWNKPRDFVVIRRQVTVSPIFFETLPGGLGYIRITQFGPGVPEGLDKALHSLKKQDSLKGLILDLRNNPGGTVFHTQHALSRFLKPSTLISTVKGKAGRWAKRQELRTFAHKYVPKNWTNFPMVVLINERSASGAELMSGALQDLGRAIVVGETSFGKGSGQFTMPLTESRGGSFLHLTVFKYYLPSGRSIHEIGVKPNIIVKAELFDEETAKEMRRLIGTDLLALYVREWLNKDRARFKRLIDIDGHDPARYPGFDALYQSLDTKLTRDQVRRVVRQYFRSKFADDQRAPFLTDVQEDPQIQRAIQEIAKKINLDTATIPQYKAIGAAPKKEPAPAK